jgi:hypothetical protein
VTKFAENGFCRFTVQCSDTLQRTRTVMREFSVEVIDGGSIHLCTIDPGFVILDERDVEDKDESVQMLSLWAEMLNSIHSQGRLPAQEFVGHVPDWTAAVLSLYGVSQDVADLHYSRQVLPNSDGRWEIGPMHLGDGWGFQHMVSGGSGSIFARTDSGDWRWYRHVGALQSPATREIVGPTDIPRWTPGDASLTHWWHFGSGFGVIYGKVIFDFTGNFTAGDLYWNRFSNYRSGQGTFETLSKVGQGWDGLSHVCSVGQGIIYGVNPAGVLLWFRHKGWNTGAFDWEGPVELQTGVDWNQYEKIVPSGDGVLCGVLPNGIMHGYRHFGWEFGHERFEGPIVIEGNLQHHRHLFANLPASIEGVN